MSQSKKQSGWREYRQSPASHTLPEFLWSDRKRLDWKFATVCPVIAKNQRISPATSQPLLPGAAFEQAIAKGAESSPIRAAWYCENPKNMSQGRLGNCSRKAA